MNFMFCLCHNSWPQLWNYDNVRGWILMSVQYFAIASILPRNAWRHQCCDVIQRAVNNFVGSLGLRNVLPVNCKLKSRAHAVSMPKCIILSRHFSDKKTSQIVNFLRFMHNYAGRTSVKAHVYLTIPIIRTSIYTREEEQNTCVIMIMIIIIDSFSLFPAFFLNF